MQLRGHGFATDTLCQEYQNLVNHVQGRRNISWDSPLDSGVSSTSSGTSIDGEGDARAPRKRANDENVNGMNSTFVMEAPKPKVKVCAEELMAKGGTDFLNAVITEIFHGVVSHLFVERNCEL